MAAVRYDNLHDFYHNLYKHEHRKTGTRALHCLGTCLGLSQLAAAAALRRPGLLLTGLASGYACAWVGHFFVEHNRPATFKYPLMSFVSDWLMVFNIATGRESLFEATNAAAQRGGKGGDGTKAS
ncbi:MAG: hypothetical protein J3K34DRAFT_405660 [Monoraphidium minutum]|nr:MAG: hypothetical protein J3K34DRAFT_405660 [Monoraphidium minutum]